MDTTDFLFSTADCCSCGRPIRENSHHLNIAQLEYMVEWDYPKMGNVVTGVDNRACAVVCDDCFFEKRIPTKAIEFRGDLIVYHPVTELQKPKNQQSNV